MEPTIALAIPPPVSPTGFGVWVRNDQFRDPAPLRIRYAKIAISTPTTMIDKLAAKPVKK
jgi:hypothetical protein